LAEERQIQELMGVPGSPYTRKMLATLRYRNIPYRFERKSQALGDVDDRHRKQRPIPKVQLLPTFYFEGDNGEPIAVTDSSPLIRRFEQEYQGRSVIPSDPALAFVDMLLEDYADEWLTKAMYHYRWYYEDDIKKAGQILPRWHAISAPEEQVQAMSKQFTERQVSRLSYVGSNAVTKPVIEASFKRLIQLLDDHFSVQPFLMGQRPGSCDFALYGQLTCMALFDPTPQAIILAASPRVYAWVEIVEDLSGYQVSGDDWIDIDHPPETLKALLSEVGRLYAPYLIANAKAVMEKAEKMETVLDGQRWEQAPFTYQAKCLKWLREAYHSLSASDRSRVNTVLTGTGVLRLFG
jgi:glutathione S-transferase